MQIGPPTPPVGIRAIGTNITTAEIIWISKFNGGSIQYFHIGVKSASDLEFMKGEKFADSGEDEVMIGFVNGLQEGIRYNFNIYAENMYGQSTLKNHLNCETPQQGNAIYIEQCMALCVEV